MESIQPVQLGGSSTMSGISGVGQSRAPTRSAAGQLQSVTNVSTAVSDMLQGIGGGLENDQMLKAMIALMIIAALLQQAMQGDASSNESLRLGTTQGDALQGMAMNAPFVSIEYTSISMNSTTVSQSMGGLDNGGQLGGQMDIAS